MEPHTNGVGARREVEVFASSGAFAPGDLVLTDEPSIVFHLLPECTATFRFLDHVADSCGLPRPSLYCLVTLSACPPAVVEELEGQFPVPAVPLEHPICQRFLAAGRMLQDSSLLPPASDSYRYCDVLLRVRLYARHVTQTNGVPALAMYPRSVKIQHSCAPNLLHFADGTTLLYRALHPIAVGDHLTISYVEDVELWKGTPQRQHHIQQTRFYICGCTRCRAPDQARAMQCKRCGGDAVVYHPALSLWRCPAGHCGREYRDSEMPLSAEALLVEYVGTLFGGDAGPPVDYLATLQHTQQTLGRRHWVAILVTYLILAKFWNAPAEKQPRGLTKRLVVALAEALADWFIQVMGECVPTANMCHFAAGILAAYGGPDKEHRYLEYDAAAQRVFAILNR